MKKHEKSYRISKIQFEKIILKLFGRKQSLLYWEIEDDILVYNVNRTKETIWESSYKLLIRQLCDYYAKIINSNDLNEISHIRFMITKVVEDNKLYQTLINRLLNDKKKDKDGSLYLSLLNDLTALTGTSRTLMTDKEYVNLIKRYDKEQLFQKINQQLK